MKRHRVSLVGPRSGFLVALAVLLGACQVSEPAADAAPGELEQWAGQHGGVSAASHRVLRDTAAWDAFWQGVEVPAPRAFHPAREQAVAVFIGERRTGGYAVRIESAEPRDGRLVVTYRESTPPRGTMVMQALTSPWALVVVPRSDLPVDVRSSAPPPPSPAQK